MISKGKNINICISTIYSKIYKSELGVDGRAPERTNHKQITNESLKECKLVKNVKLLPRSHGNTSS